MRKKEHLAELQERIQQLEAEKELLTKENLAHKTQTSSAVDPAIVSVLNGTIDYKTIKIKIIKKKKKKKKKTEEFRN